MGISGPVAAHELTKHRNSEPDQAAKRSLERYEIPDVELVSKDGVQVNLRQVLSADGPVFLNFFFTSCSTVCPVSAMQFSELQDLTANEGNPLRLISISIDPLEDTPKKLAEYARKFEAGPYWHLLTGTPQACEAVQRAFDVYRGDKMNHPLVTLFRARAGSQWVRLEGLVNPPELLSELQHSS